jgi:replicative DNA helicase
MSSRKSFKATQKEFGGGLKQAENKAQHLVPPHDLVAEQAVLGGCLVRQDLAEDILQGAREEFFYSLPHRLVLRGMLSLLAEGHPLGLLTLSDRLRKQGTLEAAGGPVYLAELAGSPVSAGNARRHMEIVRQLAQRRALIEIGSQLIETAFDLTRETTEFAGQAQEVVDAVLEDRVNVPSQRPSQVAVEAWEYLERLHDGRQSSGIIKSPLYGLNQLTGGILTGELAVLAGRPGTGKTALALNWAGYACRKGLPGGIFSLEMQRVQLALRFFAQQGVNAQRFRDGKFTDQDWRVVQNGADWLSQQDEVLRFWDRPAITPSEFRAQIRKWKREIGIKWVVLDYLQRMRPDRRWSSREQEVAEVSRAIKEAALEYDVAVLCLAQLNRDAERTKKPLLSQLRESGAVEADADMIIFLVPWDTRTDGDVVEVEIDVAKGRSNSTGSTKAFFKRPNLQFVNPNSQRKGEDLSS